MSNAEVYGETIADVKLLAARLRALSRATKWAATASLDELDDLEELISPRNGSSVR